MGSMNYRQYSSLHSKYDCAVFALKVNPKKYISSPHPTIQLKLEQLSVIYLLHTLYTQDGSKYCKEVCFFKKTSPSTRKYMDIVKTSKDVKQQIALMGGRQTKKNYACISHYNPANNTTPFLLSNTHRTVCTRAYAYSLGHKSTGKHINNYLFCPSQRYPL